MFSCQIRCRCISQRNSPNINIFNYKLVCSAIMINTKSNRETIECIKANQIEQMCRFAVCDMVLVPRLRVLAQSHELCILNVLLRFWLFPPKCTTLVSTCKEIFSFVLPQDLFHLRIAQRVSNETSSNPPRWFFSSHTVMIKAIVFWLVERSDACSPSLFSPRVGLAFASGGSSDSSPGRALLPLGSKTNSCW